MSHQRERESEVVHGVLAELSDACLSVGDGLVELSNFSPTGCGCGWTDGASKHLNFC